MAASMVTASSSASSHDPMQQDLSWLSRISSEPIFTSTCNSAKPKLVIKGSDVILLIDGQLRMMNLSAVKNGRAGDCRGTSYKTLSNAVLADEISQTTSLHRVELTLNHSQTLLAISQPTSLIVVILPRATALSSSSPTIAVKAHKVGRFYHNHHSLRSDQITCTKWHPWSKGGTSLLVLLRNGLLYEYDVARDLAEPQQSIHLLPFDRRLASPKLGVGGHRGSAAFGRQIDDDDEEDEQQAVAFTFGLAEIPLAANGDTAGPLDWTPLTVYLLTSNGDLWAAAPFLPRYARVPSSYLHSLSSYVQDSTHLTGRQREYALRFVSNLLKQARTFQEGGVDGGGSARSRATTPADILAREDLGDSGRPGMRKSQSAMSMSLEPEGIRDDQVGEGDVLDFVELKAPQMPIVPGTLTAQGPFLLAPAPHELNDARESRGTDIVFVRLPPPADSAVALDILLLSGDDGRLDVGVLNIAGKVKPSWTASSPQGRDSGAGFATRLNRSVQRKRIGIAKSGRYALSESSDEADSDGEEGDDTTDMSGAYINCDEESSGELPVLFIYETLDLGFPNQKSSSHPPPRLVKDTVYADTVYIHHAFGAHMLCLSSWSAQMARLLGEADKDELRRFLHASRESEVRCIVKIQEGEGVEAQGTSRDGVTSVQVVDDIYLGYSILVLLGDGDCLGLEMSLRPSSQAASLSMGLPSAILAQESSPSSALDLNHQGKTFYTSLLGADVFEPPAPFSPSSSSQVAFPAMRLKLTNSSVGKGELLVTPETLRLLGTSVQDLRGKMRQVVTAGNVMQRRLELQIKELHRQLGKLENIQTRIEAFAPRLSASSVGSQESSLSSRIERVTSRQSRLIQRVDRVLQASMDSADVGISKYEEVWLKEMAAMQRELGHESDEGLKAKVQKLQSQLQDLTLDLHQFSPSSTSTHQPDPSVSSSSSPAPASSSNTRLGTRQLQRILSVLSEESHRLLEARDKVQRLNKELGKSLNRT